MGEKARSVLLGLRKGVLRLLVRGDLPAIAEQLAEHLDGLLGGLADVPQVPLPENVPPVGRLYVIANVFGGPAVPREVA
jgi:hypothetical protein